MKKFFLFVVGGITAVMFCACSSFEPTQNLEDALSHVESDIEYHDRAYMEKRPLYLPVVNDVKKLGTLKFNIAVMQDASSSNTSTDHLTSGEMNKFKSELETAVAGSKRFPLAQIRYGLADAELRRSAVNGTSNTKELDVSEMDEAEGIINIRPVISSSESLISKEKTLTSTFKLDCNPVSAKNNAPLAEFQSFSIAVQSRIYQKTDKFGRTVAGFRFNSDEQLEDYHLRQGRAAIVKFFVKMYSLFPVGGAVTNFDSEGHALFKANRATGLQTNMEFIIFAVKKGEADTIPVPLYNATAITVGQTGNSTLQTWRKSESPLAKKIIGMIESDFGSAKVSYDFYACADGFAQWPDFIDHMNTKRK